MHVSQNLGPNENSIILYSVFFAPTKLARMIKNDFCFLIPKFRNLKQNLKI
jgi:hypothetical protein